MCPELCLQGTGKCNQQKKLAPEKAGDPRKRGDVGLVTIVGDRGAMPLGSF